MTNSKFKGLRNRGRLLAGAVLAVVGLGSASAQTQMSFQLLAGGWSGDGGQAKVANLNSAADVVFDKAGNLYVAQYRENRIRKITPAGVITTVAGGNTGFAGDGGPANLALLNRPQALALDAAGNLYFGDTGNRRVRRISTTGTISTVAGNGSVVSSGDGGQAVNAGLPWPGAIAIDATGNMFVADALTDVVRKITPAGVISTYAGTGVAGAEGDGGPATAAQLYGPSGVAIDTTGNLFIADTNNHVVRRVSTTGTITTVRDGFIFPDDVDVDAAGNLYVADICKISRFAGTTTTTFGTDDCGSSPDGASASTALFGTVNGIAATANGDIYFADADNGRVTRITVASDTISTYAGAPLSQPDGTPALSGTMTQINALAVDAAGSVFLSEYSENRIRKLQAGKLYNFAGNGTFSDGCNVPCGPAQQAFGLPTGVATTNAGQVLIATRKVYAVKNGVTTLYAGGGADRVSDNAPATSLYLDTRAIATDASDNLYIADYNGGRVRKVTPDGMATTIAGNGRTDAEVDGVPATSTSVYPTRVAVDTDGNVYIYDAIGVIRRVGTDGIIRRFAGVPLESPWLGGFTGEGGPALDAKLGVVNGLVAHSSGVYLSSECAVRRITPMGTIEAIAGFPNCAVGLTIKGRYLYVSTDNGRVVRALLPRITPNDFNGDFKSDLVWRASTGANVMWLGADSTTTQTIAVNPPEWKLVGQGDFDGDGKSDLFWRNTSTGAQQVWYSGNLATRMLVTTLADTRWLFAGVGDFDGDGKADLLFRHSVTGGNAIWRSGNSTMPRTIAATNPVWNVAAIADFNGDGASDILWRNSTSGANTIWKSANNTKLQGVVGVTNLNWKVVAAADYDNDGSADLIWRDVTTGANTMWRNANNGLQRAVPTVGIGWSVQPNEAQQ